MMEIENKIKAITKRLILGKLFINGIKANVDDYNYLVNEIKLTFGTRFYEIAHFDYCGSYLNIITY